MLRHLRALLAQKLDHPQSRTVSFQKFVREIIQIEVPNKKHKNKKSTNSTLKHMKPKSIKSLLALALLAPGALFAQTTAKTTPVGYVSLGDTTSGQPACKANTDIYFSIPLIKPAVAAASITTITGNDLILGGVALGDLTTVAHYAVITSGPATGLVTLITANTATQITVAPQAGDSIASVVVTNGVKICPAWTVGNLLGSGMPVGTSLFTLPTAGAVNPSAEGIYDWDGTNWMDNVVSGAPADNDVLYPNETLILRNGSATPITSFVVNGDVPVAGSRVYMPAATGATDYAVSFFGPVGEPVGTSGLSAVASNGDSLFGFDNNAAGINKSASVILDYDGAGNWVDNVVSGAPDNTYPIGQGAGFIFRKVAAAAGQVWSNTQDYVPTL